MIENIDVRGLQKSDVLMLRAIIASVVIAPVKIALQMTRYKSLQEAEKSL